MKKIFAAVIALYLLVPAAFGQSDWVPTKSIGVSFFVNDFATANKIRTTSLSSVINSHGWSKLKDLKTGLAITYFQEISKHVDFAASVGGSYVIYPMPSTPFTTENFLLEANATVNLKMLTDNYWVQPYIIAGIGAHKYTTYYGAFIPVGLGMRINLFPKSFFFITTEYRVPVTTETANYHFQHSLGLALNLGKKKPKVVPPPPPPPPPVDTDKDGIPDSLDKCPTVAGVLKYDGCPIPDTDKDGINDEEDKCPTVPGLARYQGCPAPDTDKDGINDDDDKCPTVPGVARYQGCPVPDTDGDGVNDEDDKCPNLAGSPDNQGCPLVSAEVKKKVDYAANNILFVTGSFKLLPNSFKGLDDVVKIMNENPDLILVIDGHTDNVGSDEMNQTLSDNRADAVKKYLIRKGVAEGRISAAGHGETMPIADNNTAAGRQKNRRVELKLNYVK